MSMSRARRILRDALSDSGRRALGARLASRLSDRVPPSLLQYHLTPEEVVSQPVLIEPDWPLPPGQPMRVGWVLVPPGPGSGGHTTAFRMVKALEDAGHDCVLVLYDPFHGDSEEQESVIRQYWPELRADVRRVEDGFDGLDACVATGWQTAHVIARHTAGLPLRRFYFIQDYEPYFYPAGFAWALAEQTYAFGFHNIALGHMVAENLSTRGFPSDMVPFGCDTDTYSLTNTGPRDGIAFYSRAGTSRRGFLLAKMALTEVHARAPHVPIHVYGPLASSPLDVPVVDHGRLTPQELNRLYNQCVAGLALSFTNVSLVVGEMLAAGCVPVANDWHDARKDETSPYVRWADATPTAIAEGLLEVLERPPADVARVAASIGSTWTETGKRFVEVVERVTYRS